MTEQGIVNRKKIGGRAVAWWVSDTIEQEVVEISADDPLFAAPTFTIGEPIDDVLYGEVNN